MKKIKQRRRRLRLSSPIGFSVACILVVALLAGLYVGISWCVKHGPAVVTGVRDAILADSATSSPDPTTAPTPEVDINATPAPENTPQLGTPNPIPTEVPGASSKPKDPSAPLYGYTIGLDPFRDKNSQYKFEADNNLAFAQRLGAYLEEKGADVVITRENSTEVYSETDRIATVKTANCDLVIRFICNHVSKNNTNGAYAHAASANKAFAQLLLDEYRATTGLRERKGGVETKSGEFYTGTGCPSVQLVLGHWTNSSEQKKLKDTEFQDKMIEGIYNALLKQLTQ